MFTSTSSLTQGANVANLQLYRQHQLRGVLNASGGRFPHALSNPAAMAMFQQAASKSGIKPLTATSFCRQPEPSIMPGPTADSLHFQSPPPPLELPESFGILKETGNPSLMASRFPHSRSLQSVSHSPVFTPTESGIGFHSAAPDLEGRLPLPKPNNASEIFQRNRSSSFGIY